jgi:hypothetical protein
MGCCTRSCLELFACDHLGLAHLLVDDGHVRGDALLQLLHVVQERAAALQQRLAGLVFVHIQQPDLVVLQGF